jgi:hypothetical protein
VVESFSGSSLLTGTHQTGTHPGVEG